MTREEQAAWLRRKSASLDPCHCGTDRDTGGGDSSCSCNCPHNGDCAIECGCDCIQRDDAKKAPALSAKAQSDVLWDAASALEEVERMKAWLREFSECLCPACGAWFSGDRPHAPACELTRALIATPRPATAPDHTP